MSIKEPEEVPGTGIDLYSYATWSRTTIADGKWLQNNTLRPIYENELILASAVHDTSASLQDEIDDMKAATDVIDVVASYQDLTEWNKVVTSADVLKVLHCDPVTVEGETFSGQVYFRYDGPDAEAGQVVSADWVPFASLDPYYSKSEIDRMLAETSAYVETASGNVWNHADTLDSENRDWTENTVSADLYHRIEEASGYLDGKIDGVRSELVTASGRLKNMISESSGTIRSELTAASGKLRDDIAYVSGQLTSSASSIYSTIQSVSGTLEQEIEDMRVDVDLHYSPTSTNAQAGTAVAEAISGKQDKLSYNTSENAYNINITGNAKTASSTTSASFAGLTSALHAKTGDTEHKVSPYRELYAGYLDGAENDMSITIERKDSANEQYITEIRSSGIKTNGTMEAKAFYGMASSAAIAVDAQNANHASLADLSSYAQSVNNHDNVDNKNMIIGYNSSVDAYTVSLSDEKGGTLHDTEITPSGISTIGTITAGGGFIGNVTNATLAQMAVKDQYGRIIDTRYSVKPLYLSMDIAGPVSAALDSTAPYDDLQRLSRVPVSECACFDETVGTMIYFANLVFSDITLSQAPFPYSIVDIELWSGPNPGQDVKLGGNTIILKAGVSNFNIVIPFAVTQGTTFRPVLYGNFGRAGTSMPSGGKVIGNHFYIGLNNI